MGERQRTKVRMVLQGRRPGDAMDHHLPVFLRCSSVAIGLVAPDLATKASHVIDAAKKPATTMKERIEVMATSLLLRGSLDSDSARYCNCRLRGL